MSSCSARPLLGPALAPLNFIYACAVCCNSFADVYEGRHETAQGFSDGINPRDRLVTRLWLASCCHVFCSSHLEGGGPSFHPEAQRPKVSCPVCVREDNDSTLRDLYSIRGFQSDEHDPMIPPVWFDAPPITLHGNGKEMEALRFQYLALVRYCQYTYTTRKLLQDAMTCTKTELTTMRKILSREQTQTVQLRKELDELLYLRTVADDPRAEATRIHNLEQELEQYRQLKVNPKDLASFQNNKTAIMQYLKLVPCLVDQNRKMEDRLASLGFAMALEPVPNLKDIDLKVLDNEPIMVDDVHLEPKAKSRGSTSSCTFGRSSNVSRHHIESSSPYFHRQSKRQRVESPMDIMSTMKSTGRTRMLTPLKPGSQTSSVRKIIPKFRRTFFRTQPSPTDKQHSDLSMCDSQQWQRSRTDDDTDAPIRQEWLGNTQYMSGALSTIPPSRVSITQPSQLLSSLEIEHSQSQITFQTPSSAKSGKQIHHHSSNSLRPVPWCIQPMDGLSQNEGIEVRLSDPRRRGQEAYSARKGAGKVFSFRENQRSCQKIDDQRLWSSGLCPPELHFQRAPCVSHTQQESTNIDQQQKQEQIIPAFRKGQCHDHSLESVVSPLVESEQHMTLPMAKPGITESYGSSRYLAAFQSRKPRTIIRQQNLHEARTLNGLSFFDNTFDSHHHPIPYNWKKRYNDRSMSAINTQCRILTARGCTDARNSSWNRLACTETQKLRPGNENSFSRMSMLARIDSSKLPSAIPSVANHGSRLRTVFPPRQSQQVRLRSGQCIVRHNQNAASMKPATKPFRNVDHSSVQI